jgi:Protein of unknown function (DUF3800)
MALTLARWNAPNTSLIFSDESSLGEKYCVFGALYLWCPNERCAKEITRLENELAELKSKHGIRTVKWKDVPEPSLKLQGYEALVKHLATQKARLRFKCMVVDTHAFPLGNRRINDGDRLVGYMKYYTVFLADGLMLTQKGYFYDITIDNYSFRPKSGHDSRTLGRCVEGRYRNSFQPTDPARNPRLYQHSQLQTVNDEDSNLVQMADLFAGAVAFCKTAAWTERVKFPLAGRNLWR